MRGMVVVLVGTGACGDWTFVVVMTVGKCGGDREVLSVMECVGSREVC